MLKYRFKFNFRESISSLEKKTILLNDLISIAQILLIKKTTPSTLRFLQKSEQKQKTLRNKTRLLVSGQSPECSNCLLKSMKQKHDEKIKHKKMKKKW